MPRHLTIMTYVIAMLLISTGGFIYLCYRPLSLRIFEWTGLSASTQWLAAFRSASTTSMPEWVVYAFPDGLWACAYTICIGAIWDFSFSKCIPVALAIPIVGIMSELLQAIGQVQGVFDYADLIAYIVGAIIGLVYIYMINRKLNNIKKIV